ncbi:hypothetical protein ISCGN_003435 [Ixodes scapularis]
MDLFPVSFCACVHSRCRHFCRTPGRGALRKWRPQHYLRAYLVYFDALFLVSVVWDMKSTENRYNGTMPTCFDGRRHVGLLFYYSSQTTPQTALVTRKRFIAWLRRALLTERLSFLLSGIASVHPTTCLTGRPGGGPVGFRFVYWHRGGAQGT